MLGASFVVAVCLDRCVWEQGNEAPEGNSFCNMNKEMFRGIQKQAVDVLVAVHVVFLFSKSTDKCMGVHGVGDHQACFASYPVSGPPNHTPSSMVYVRGFAPNVAQIFGKQWTRRVEGCNTF